MIDSDEEKAFVAYGKGNYREAMPALSKLAEKGDTHALLAVAWMNEVGAVDDCNIERAQILYRRAADAGSTDALHRLGRLLQKLNDRAGAIEAFERGAIAGHLPSISSLGTILTEAPEKQEDTDTGLFWLNTASERGHLFAKRKLIQFQKKNTKSLLKKMILNIQFVFLSFEYFGEYFRDWNSDRIS